MFPNSARTDLAVDFAEYFFVVDRLRRMCSDSIRLYSIRCRMLRSIRCRMLRSDRRNQSSESQPELVCCGDKHHHQMFEPGTIWFLLPAALQLLPLYLESRQLGSISLTQCRRL
jgi:hypothetical protein